MKEFIKGNLLSKLSFASLIRFCKNGCLEVHRKPSPGTFFDPLLKDKPFSRASHLFSNKVPLFRAAK